MDARLLEFTNRLEGAYTREAVAMLLGHTAAACGYRSLGLVLPDVPAGDGPFQLFDHASGPDGLYCRTGFYTSDLFVSRARHAFLPFTWGTQGDDAALTTPDGQRQAEAAQAAGLPKALFVPVHGPQRCFGMLVALSQEPDGRFLDINRRQAPFLRLAAMHLHDYAFRRLVGDPDRSELTQRERQVIGHFAVGATAAQVAVKLGISPRTVTFHVENAKRKLGAPTIAGAVARALCGGLVAA